MDEKYLQVALTYLSPNIREALTSMDEYSYCRAKYGVEVSELDTSGLGITKEDLHKEYKEWRESKSPEKQFIDVAVPAFNSME